MVTDEWAEPKPSMCYCLTGKGRQRKLSMPMQSSSSSMALRPFSWTWPPFFFYPPVTPVFCRSTSAFSIEQFGSVLPHFVTPTTPRLSSGSSSSATSLENSFRNSVVENRHYTKTWYYEQIKFRKLYHSRQNHPNCRCSLYKSKDCNIGYRNELTSMHESNLAEAVD